MALPWGGDRMLSLKNILEKTGDVGLYFLPRPLPTLQHQFITNTKWFENHGRAVDT